MLGYSADRDRPGHYHHYLKSRPRVQFSVSDETDRLPVAEFLEGLVERGVDDTEVMAAAAELGLLDG